MIVFNCIFASVQRTANIHETGERKTCSNKRDATRIFRNEPTGARVYQAVANGCSGDPLEEQLMYNKGSVYFLLVFFFSKFLLRLKHMDDI